MAKNQMTLIGTSDPGCDGQREWRFVVNGQRRAYYTVRAVNRQAAESLLDAQVIDAKGLGEKESGIVTAALFAAFGFVVYKAVQWWQTKYAANPEGE